MDDALGWAIRAFSPGAACIILGNALSIWAALRTRRSSRWGIRLTVLGFALLKIVPGTLVVWQAATGQLLWPAATFGATLIALGLLFLWFLRQNWAHRPADANSDTTDGRVRN